MAFTMYDLQRVIAERVKKRKRGSYSVKLLKEGREKCAKKVGEEAIELILEATRGTKKRTIAEAADLFYHILVLLKARGITLREVEKEFARRASSKADSRKSNRRGT